MTQAQPTVAISSDFFTAFSKLPRNMQNKVTNFLSKFKHDPLMPGINYEKIRDAKNTGYRSVRIDDTYRGIVLKPNNELVYLLLWVDHHDKAYDWARRKKCEVNPETGSLQIFDSREAESEGGAETAEKNNSKAAGIPRLFDNFRDRNLVRLGVPEEFLPRVRKIKSAEELELLKGSLPQEAYEALFFLGEGFSLQEVYAETGKAEEEKSIDTDDFRTALEKPDSRHRFYVVADDLELQAMLQAPLEKWRVFMHPTQRKIVEREWNGPMRALGEAGTGKTVAAMHRARWLTRHIFRNSEQKILFTTFTRNLAADIEQNLKTICSPGEMKRIEIVNLDRWVFQFLRQQGYEYTIVYPEKTKSLWEQAHAAAPDEPALPLSFYQEEWTNVLQPHGIGTFSEYARVSRVGRGVPLNRKTRRAIWPVFEEYRLLLNDRGLREADDAMRDARELIAREDRALPYVSVIVDEAQDMGSQAFKLLRRIVPEAPNDMFIVGDGHQRIYRHCVVLGRCGIKIVGRSRKLRINYRTTEETRRWATSVLKNISIDDLDAGDDDKKGTASLMNGVEPRIEYFKSFEDECSYLIDLAGNLQNEGRLNSVCLVARTKSVLQKYGRALEEAGLPVCQVRRDAPEDRNTPGIRLATMHRVKGLEFDTMIIAGANASQIPLQAALESTDDPAEREDRELRERTLFYVAATRAKKEVIVTGFGKKSPFVEKNSGGINTNFL